MPRKPRSSVGDQLYHVLNRGNCRMRIFSKDADFAAFCKLLQQARDLTSVRIVGFCLMHNHWHLILWPRHDGDLSRFMQWLTTTHVRRWREHRQTTGEGHLYQGRYKSFLIQSDDHLLTALRYVEQNPLRASMVDDAQRWNWSSACPSCPISPDPGPIAKPRHWPANLRHKLTDEQLAILRTSLQRSRPFGDSTWVSRIAKRLGLTHTLRDPWRPKGTFGRKHKRRRGQATPTKSRHRASKEAR